MYLLVSIIFFESNNIHDFIDKIAEFAEYSLPQLAFFFICDFMQSAKLNI